MYIGGTDEKALHHLFAEVIDNSMDEAVAGHASWINVEPGHRGMAHRHRQRPRHSGRSASQIQRQIRARSDHDHAACRRQIWLTGLRHLGRLARRRRLGRQRALRTSRGRGRARADSSTGRPMSARRARRAAGKARQNQEPARHERCVSGPIQGDFRQGVRLQARAAVPHGPLESLSVRRRRNPLDMRTRTDQGMGDETPPTKPVFHFPGGLGDFLSFRLEGATTVTQENFFRPGRKSEGTRHGRMGCELGSASRDGFFNSYCNTVPTPEGGTHEAGMRAAFTKGLKAIMANWRETNAQRQITADDVIGYGGCDHAVGLYLASRSFRVRRKTSWQRRKPSRIVETAVRDAFEHWLTASPGPGQTSCSTGSWSSAEERMRRRREREVNRKSSGAQIAPARQTRRLLGQNAAEGHGNIHRRGGLSRRFRQAGTRPGNPGRASSARQDPQRCQAPVRQKGSVTTSCSQ